MYKQLLQIRICLNKCDFPPKNPPIKHCEIPRNFPQLVIAVINHAKSSHSSGVGCANFLRHSKSTPEPRPRAGVTNCGSSNVLILYITWENKVCQLERHSRTRFSPKCDAWFTMSDVTLFQHNQTDRQIRRRPFSHTHTQTESFLIKLHHLRLQVEDDAMRRGFAKVLNPVSSNFCQVLHISHHSRT